MPHHHHNHGHLHVDHGEDFEPDEVDLARNPDEIQLNTVGIDVGTSTSHLMFSRLYMRRLGKKLSSRFVVARREPLHRSEIHFTPYRADRSIDADRLGEIVDTAFQTARLAPQDVDTGAVILTGEAADRVNAPAIAEMVSARTGHFVCTTAGHNLEAVLAANGSGAVELSRDRECTVLNIDLGGGTAKLALIERGRVTTVSAIAVGGRLLGWDAGRRLNRIEDPAQIVAETLGIELAIGRFLDPAEEQRIADVFALCLARATRGGELHDLARQLLLTPPLPEGIRPDLLTYSGGVSEFLYHRETADFGDLGASLARAVGMVLPPSPLENAGQGIRATVTGASQFTVQLSGDTLSVSDPTVLPLRDLPVVTCSLDDGPVNSESVAEQLAAAFRRLDIVEGAQPVAVAVTWDGAPSYRALRGLAEGLASGLPRTLEKGLPVVAVFSQDVAKNVGNLLKRELHIRSEVVSIDGVELQELDFIDIGDPLEVQPVVPVVVKSLVFAMWGETSTAATTTP